MKQENTIQAGAPVRAAKKRSAGTEKPKQPNRRRRFWTRQRQQRVFTMPYMFFSIAGVLLFYILPFAVVIFYALIDNTTNANFVGIDNFVKLFDNNAFRLALKNTGVFSVTAVPFAVILSLGLAVLLEQNLPGKSVFRTIFLSPMIVPAASIILIWQVMFDYNGVINDITALFGAQPVEWMKSEYGYIVVVLLFLWKNIGYNMIMFMSALAAVPKDILEVAMLDGCGPAKRFFMIKLRYLASTISYVTIMSLINSFKVFREVYLLTGDYPYDSMYTLQHFMNNTFRNFDYQKLSSAAIVLSLIMIVIIGILLWADNRLGRDIEE
ncbi:MAG: sugar ABC transporter permease [Clostridia bacterium]|nr:sugar ABC transporter permease [Clostridia bacterium]